MSLSRRWIVAAAMAGTAAVVLTPVAIAAAQQQPTADPAAAAPAPPSAAPVRPSAAPAPDQAPPSERLGAVVDAGHPAKQGTWVLYAVAIEEKSLPGTAFGIMAGRRLADGTITGDVLANETDGRDRAPGFHAGQAGMDVNGEPTPSFGYYTGPATKITARAGKRTVTARQAPWSEDASVQIYWFDPSLGAVRSLKAYDKEGRRLTAGNDQVGVG